MTAASRFAPLPVPPYYAVIFASQMDAADEGYAALSKLMVQRALEHFGCLGAESARDASGFGITISYWNSEEDIRKWYQDAKHQAAQKLGKDKFYSHYSLRIAKVERAYAKDYQRQDQP